ncbi:MAG TPA: SDR family oxidoreductase [Candidatus Wunengus sp. YC64]|uniref:SDR family oxidoreductase n=1 Tax=Candidatus Wunengus sp. YC64 TaxID=3367700 RepID=UPI0040273A1C
MSYLEDVFNLKEKVVVVTGAIGQIGTQICKAYRETGSKVIGVDIKAHGVPLEGVDYYTADITKKRDIVSSFGHIIKKYRSIDILINNAGVSVFEPFEERSEESFDLVMDVNLKGTFFCIQSYINLFDKYKLNKGAIVNIASFYGVISPDFRIYTDCNRKNSEIYGATKAGVIQMTKYFGVHLADRNIRVNAVSPGGIYNPDNPQGEDFIKNYSFRCPMKRMGNDKELLGAIMYLSSDAASYTTGQNIIVDGGMSCW